MYITVYCQNTILYVGEIIDSNPVVTRPDNSSNDSDPVITRPDNSSNGSDPDDTNSGDNPTDTV